MGFLLAAGLALFIPGDTLTPEVLSRTAPDLRDLVVAIDTDRIEIHAAKMQLRLRIAHLGGLTIPVRSAFEVELDTATGLVQVPQGACRTGVALFNGPLKMHARSLRIGPAGRCNVQDTDVELTERDVGPRLTLFGGGLEPLERLVGIRHHALAAQIGQPERQLSRSFALFGSIAPQAQGR